MLVRAAVFRQASQPLAIEEVELSPPRAGEVLVRMAAAGVCHSDWHVVTGATAHPTPVVLGHEGAGVIEGIGPEVTDFKPGDHVALNWAPACRTCFYCQHELPYLCATYLGAIWDGTMLDGTMRFASHGQGVRQFSALGCFAQRVVVPQQACVALEPAIPMSVAALIGCAVTTGVGAVVNTARVTRGSTVAVFGAGGVGLSIVLGAKLAGADQMIAIDPSPNRRRFAMELGATYALSPDYAVDWIRTATAGRGADFVFEAVGVPQVQEASLAAARPGGTVVLAGLAPMGSTTNLPGAVLTREAKTVIGCYYGSSDPPRDFRRFANWYREGRLAIDRLVSRTYTLEQINQAYADMLAGTTARGVIVFE